MIEYFLFILFLLVGIVFITVLIIEKLNTTKNLVIIFSYNENDFSVLHYSKSSKPEEYLTKLREYPNVKIIAIYETNL